jgi:cleavage and polyadenylation specificity factor subunit 2
MEEPVKVDIIPPQDPMDEDGDEEDHDEEDRHDSSMLDVSQKPAKKEEKSQRELVPTLEPLPVTQVDPHATVFVNELKLSDFKQVLMKAGIQAEFSAGILYCNNGLVAIRRNDKDRIQLEGCLCEDYYKVREILYEQYAII